MKTKHNKTLSIIALATLIITVIGASFAYFGATTNTGSGSALSTVIEENDVLFTATGSSMTLNITADKMSQQASLEGEIVAGDSSDSKLDISLVVGSENPIACTYNIYYKWDSSASAYLAKTSGADKEFTAQLALTGGGSEGNNKLKNETQFTDVITTTNKTLVVEGAAIVASASSEGSQTWTPTIKFYNLKLNQSALAGKSFAGKFTIDDVSCGGLKNLSETVIAKVSNTDYISSQENGGVYKVARETVEYEDETLDAGVRFEGLDPDNYVTFNGQTAGWRIIGVFEGSTIGLEPGKQYTKLITTTSIGDYAWDSNLGSDWENSTLNAYLNGSYLSSMIDSNKIAQYNGNYSTWYLRGLDSETYKSAYTPDWYLVERYTGQTGYRDGQQYAAAVSTKAAIGLMYPSDYGYAAYGNFSVENYGDVFCDNKTLSVLSDYEDGCAEVDWLVQDSIDDHNEWLISPVSDLSGNVFRMHGTGGGFISNGGAVFLNDTRPVLYLEADVMTVGGNGSKENPYILYKESEPTLSEKILAKVSDSEYTSSQAGGGVYKIAHETVDYNGETLDAGVRYEGKDPDNYVTFNGSEEWRIIGVFEGSTIGLETGKQYTKIIKSTSIGIYEWNKNGTTDWANATLNQYLNGDYLASMRDGNKIAKYNNQYSVWSFRTGGSGGYFISERITGKAPLVIDKDGEKVEISPFVNEAVGLMYLSDLDYAQYDNECKYCVSVNWLIMNNDGEWSITPDRDDECAAYAIVFDGSEAASIDLVDILYQSFNVRPTLYLEANLTATGNGSKLDPYVLN